MTARSPSRVIARTPLRMPVTICRKKASETAPRGRAGESTLRGAGGPAGRPSEGCSSDPEKWGVRALVKSGKRSQQGKPYARAQHSELQLNQLFSRRSPIQSGPPDYGYVILARFWWLPAGGLTIRS